MQGTRVERRFEKDINRMKIEKPFLKQHPIGIHSNSIVLDVVDFTKASGHI